MLLDALLVVIRLFQLVFFFLKLITWPVRALIRSAARRHKATLERQQYDTELAHYEVKRAAEQAFKRARFTIFVAVSRKCMDMHMKPITVGLLLGR